MIAPEDYAEWLGHPVTEWVLGLMRGEAEAMKTKWANLAWETGELEALAFTEARVRADCYLALPDTSFDDWKALDATRD